MTDITPIAHRTKTEPFFLGYYIHAYAVANDLNAEGIAKYLSCPMDRLEQLMLCRMPGTKAEVNRVAEYVPCDANTLFSIVFPGRQKNE